MSVACVKFTDGIEPFRFVKTSYSIDNIREVLHNLSKELLMIEKDILTFLLDKKFHDYYYSINQQDVIEKLENPTGKDNLTEKEEKIKIIFLKLLEEILKKWEGLKIFMRVFAVKIIIIFCEAFEFLYALIPDSVSGFDFKSYIKAQLSPKNI